MLSCPPEARGAGSPLTFPGSLLHLRECLEWLHPDCHHPDKKPARGWRRERGNHIRSEILSHRVTNAGDHPNTAPRRHKRPRCLDKDIGVLESVHQKHPSASYFLK